MVIEDEYMCESGLYGSIYVLASSAMYKSHVIGFLLITNFGLARTICVCGWASCGKSKVMFVVEVLDLGG